MFVQRSLIPSILTRSACSVHAHPSLSNIAVRGARGSSLHRPFSCRSSLLSTNNDLQTAAEEESVVPYADEERVEGAGSVKRGSSVANRKQHSVCSGCGARFQSSDPDAAGFVPKTKLDGLRKLLNTESSSDVDGAVHTPGNVSPVICKRCFSLKEYNTALNISLSADDYLRYLGHLRDKKSLILLMVDVSDFPGSVFPDLHTLLSPDSQIVIVANKVDLITRDVPDGFWKHFRKMIIDECRRLSISDRDVARVHFVSAKTGLGVSELAEDIVGSWGNRGDVYLLGCTNAGKSTLFNRLLVYMCGVKPGELNTDSKVFAPVATISQWPGTTLGLLSFPIMSVGKRKRLLAQAQARKLKLALNPPGKFS